MTVDIQMGGPIVRRLPGAATKPVHSPMRRSVRAPKPDGEAMAQRSSTTAFAKSTRPEISGVVQRDALFSRLDGTPARTVVWISAPPGFGKTTLAGSYVEARNYRWAWYQVDLDDDDGETFL